MWQSLSKMSCDSQDSNASSGSRCHLWVYQERVSLWDSNENCNNGPPPVRKHKPLGLSHSFPRGLAASRWQQPVDSYSNKPPSYNETNAGHKKRRRRWVLKSNQRSWPSSSKWCVSCVLLFLGYMVCWFFLFSYRRFSNYITLVFFYAKKLTMALCMEFIQLSYSCHGAYKLHVAFKVHWLIVLIFTLWEI